MVKNKKPAAIILGLMMSIVSGCSIGTQVTSQEILSTNTLVIETPLNPEISTQPSASMFEPTISHTPTPIITFTLPATQTPTHIRTSSPTTTPDPRLAQGLEYLIKNPFRCATPCLWGIIPEKTDLNETQKILLQIGITLTQTVPNYYATDFSLSNGLLGSIVLKDIGSTIGGIRLQMGGFSKSTKRSDWGAYSVDQIINAYGEPTKIDIIITTAHDVPSTNTIFLFYSLYYENFIVMYSDVTIEPVNGSYQFCPKQDMVHIVDVWYGRQAPNMPSPVGYRLDEISSLDIAGFSKLLSTESNPCINLKIDSLSKKQ